ncbi:winged helix DNA-binding domain-containing protein [Kribbella solani]|uniref:winged helix DNA-binding domain-containing protein n=1 Tax=Kribbella solani TaxID=236067 RepID=UPI0029A4EF12|nr:winged helix DNA-binding domain-containing protein [Kribbella solani]MDX3001985.1 winged helix DNA-binding domain-containing protein [Kribbella solani]
MEISWEAVVARRMRRHFLTEPAATPVQAVRAMCGAHAQIAAAGEVSVALRVAGATRATVQQQVMGATTGGQQVDGATGGQPVGATTGGQQVGATTGGQPARGATGGQPVGGATGGRQVGATTGGLQAGGVSVVQEAGAGAGGPQVDGALGGQQVGAGATGLQVGAGVGGVGVGLVKTFGARGTVHLLPVEDLGMWTGALGALPSVSQPQGAIRMSADEIAQVVVAIGEALAEDDLTVDELSAEVIRRTGPWAHEPTFPAFQGEWSRWRQAISVAAHAGVLCHGPMRGRLTTYSNPHRRQPFEPMPADKALTELLHRYLYAYGPATPQQFARWLKVPATAVKPYFADLPYRRLADQTVWYAPGDGDFSDERAEGVRLLPYFDAYGVGSYPRELLFPGKAFARATARGQAGNYPLLLVDGVVAGVWHQKKAGRTLQFTVEALSPLNKRRRGLLEQEVDRLGEVLGGTPSLTLGEVTVGAHA